MKSYAFDCTYARPKETPSTMKGDVAITLDTYTYTQIFLYLQDIHLKINFLKVGLKR